MHLFKYADDSKLLQTITNESDPLNLQAAINHLLRWCNDFGMELHPDKCRVVHFGCKNPQNDYYIGQNQIESADVVKDLGIYVNRNLEPSVHVAKIARKAHVVLSQIQRATTLRDSKTFIGLYKSFVRPHLETAASVWNPSKREDVIMLEKFQRSAFRMVTDLGDIPYDQKLKNEDAKPGRAEKARRLN